MGRGLRLTVSTQFGTLSDGLHTPSSARRQHAILRYWQEHAKFGQDVKSLPNNQLCDFVSRYNYAVSRADAYAPTYQNELNFANPQNSKIAPELRRRLHQKLEEASTQNHPASAEQERLTVRAKNQTRRCRGRRVSARSPRFCRTLGDPIASQIAPNNNSRSHPLLIFKNGYYFEHRTIPAILNGTIFNPINQSLTGRVTPLVCRSTGLSFLISFG